jgi:hypothetical protein
MQQTAAMRTQAQAQEQEQQKLPKCCGVVGTQPSVRV